MTYIVFDSEQECEAAHGELAAQLGIPNEETKTYRVYDAIEEPGGKRAVLITDPIPANWQLDKQKTETEILSLGFSIYFLNG